ncbi:signal transduction histidine kinase [Catenuloplanes nepalensis]|uniref:Oxygen sensor histidine kinase NreB n=1 Tax=Catenuloplanes nepalensis TaxID=587533 RepID=A0ABT9MVL9_9ACTN|nr:sensor histidine kinase [Catenuloplanes nepalensis]MDP9795492.1 signal transduction histidine kinase [Catenuloplanes nepalensis]
MRWWPYALLAALAAVNATSPAVLALCALTATWMLQPWWRRGVLVTGLIALNAALVWQTPWFGLFTPVSYVFAFRLLNWPWLPVGVGAVAVVAGTAQASGVDNPFIVAVVIAGNVVPMCGFAWFAQRAARHEEEREDALAEVQDANRRLAASLAENAALHERLLTQTRDAAVREERERMAREIHDTLAQGLTGIISQLRAASHASDDPARWRRHVDIATALAGESLAEARRSVHALRPEPLRAARLMEALSGVAARWSALHGIPVQVTTTGTPLPVPPDAEDALLRIAQESLTNVAKHAEATRVDVTLSFLEGEVALDVLDDGRGFALPAGPGGTASGTGGSPSTSGAAGFAGGGFGLIGMRQRMENLSGTLQVESEPGAGTGISARVPVAGSRKEPT